VLKTSTISGVLRKIGSLSLSLLTAGIANSQCAIGRASHLVLTRNRTVLLAQVIAY